MSKTNRRPRLKHGWKSWFHSLFAPPRAAGGSPRRLHLESLESRWVRSSFAVTDNSDNAGDPNSLRYAIENLAVGSSASTNTITIASGLTGGQTIALGSLLDINHGVTITGPGADTVALSGGNAVGVFKVESGVDASIAGLTITNGAASSGGGIDNLGTLSLADCTLSGNSATAAAPGGGAIYNGSGSLSIANCTISGNSSAENGGGLRSAYGSVSIANSTISGNSAVSWGGGIYALDGSLSIANSTISGNTANDSGGGLYNRWSSLSIANSTISGNSATHRGGGLYNGYGSLSIANCTVSGNTATGGGGIYSAATMTLQNSIVSANAATNARDVLGGFTDRGDNLLGTALDTGSPPASDVFSNTPGLAALGNYGGATETMALLPGSSGLGAGSALGGGISTTDQRGVTRPGSGPIDIGAYQSQGFTMTLAGSASPQTALVGTGFANALALTVTANGVGGAVNGGVVTFTANAGVIGQSATLSGSRVTISGGQASVTATADNQPGAYTVSASPGNTSSPVSFGLTNQGGSVTGTVFNDVNGNGRQDTGENGLAGVTVYLDLNNSGQFVSGDPSAVTDGNGNYTIVNVALGGYTVREEAVPGSVSVSTPAGGRASVDLSAGAPTASVDFGQIPSSVALPVVAQPNLYSNNTSDATVSYVDSLYRAILSRLPGLAEYEYWAGVLNSLGGVAAATARQVVASGIWNAPEHRLDEVAAFYQSLLGRSSSGDAGAMFWVNELQAGVGELAVVQGIMSTAEYQNKTAGNNTLFVQNLLGALGIAGSTTVTMYGSSVDLLAGLNNGTLTRSQAVGGAVFSDQSLETVVGSMYQAFFQRTVDANAGSYWSGQMRTTGVENVVVGLLASPEYFQKIQASL